MTKSEETSWTGQANYSASEGIEVHAKVDGRYRCYRCSFLPQVGAWHILGFDVFGTLVETVFPEQAGIAF